MKIAIIVMNIDNHDNHAWENNTTNPDLERA